MAGDGSVRVATWNLAFRGLRCADRFGEMLREVDLALLQEANPRSLDRLCASAGFDWVVTALDAGAGMSDDERARRRRPSAIAGRGVRPSELALLNGVALPAMSVGALVELCDHPVWMLSYHAPPGVMWGYGKVEHALALRDWIDEIPGPVLVGADANTPKVDHPDADLVRTHWHTGVRAELAGRVGDDVMFGAATRTHRLTDALRSYLANQPAEMDRIKRERPDGPLAVSHRTGRRKDFAGVPRRYDAIWHSPEFTVTDCRYGYDGALAAGSDHALVVADLAIGDSASG